MSKPDDIPQDVLEQGRVIWIEALADGTPDAAIIIARAILAERERCAAVAERFILVYATSSHDIHVAMQGAAKEDAAAEIAAAIRKGGA